MQSGSLSAAAFFRNGRGGYIANDSSLRDNGRAHKTRFLSGAGTEPEEEHADEDKGQVDGLRAQVALAEQHRAAALFPPHGLFLPF